MSLPAFALRVAAIRMLRGATLAGPNVYDSPLDPVPQALAATSPLIHVYTEGETLKTDRERTLLQGERIVNVTLQVFIPVDQKIDFGGKQMEIASRRGGGQAVLDIIYRQIEAAFVADQGAWHDLFRRIVDGYKSVSSRPYVIQTDKGVRLAAREIEFVCDTQSSPAFGSEMSDLWSDFIAAMTADADLKVLAPFVQAEITGDAVLTQSETDEFLLGLSAYESSAVGMSTTIADVNNNPNGATTIDDVSASPDALAPDGYTVA